MTGITVLAVVFVGYALIARRLDRWSITAPMVFVLTGAVLGPDAADILPISLDSRTTLTITELTLALLLFADAATVQFKQVKADARVPGRLLFVGLPLTVVFGALVAYLVLPSVGWAVAALIATILAPTDAALGLAVFTNPDVPVRIRRALNVESGLNDGIATPFVTMFIAGVTAEIASGETAWGREALAQISLAVITAVAVGAGGGFMLRLANSHGWTSKVSEQLAVLSLALLAYEGSVAIGGNGFVAAFAGGLCFGAVTQSSFSEPIELTETAGLFASFFVWLVFGALFVGAVLTEAVSWRAIGYAVISLTLVRMLPVAIALYRLRFRFSTVMFMGWFGPRGLASVVFTLVALEDFESGGIEASTLVEVATWTILLSVLLHGLSASPLASRYGRAMSNLTDVPELGKVKEPSMRLRSLSGRHHHAPKPSAESPEESGGN